MGKTKTSSASATRTIGSPLPRPWDSPLIEIVRPNAGQGRRVNVTHPPTVMLVNSTGRPMMSPQVNSLRGLTLVGTASALGLWPRAAVVEPSPETTGLRLTQTPAAYLAPQYVAEEFLSRERLTDSGQG